MSIDISKISGSPYSYDYEGLQIIASEAELVSYCQEQRSRFATIAKSFSDESNTQWVARHYLAVKLLLSASMLLGTSQRSREHNIRITEPYLHYYAILSCCRAFLFTTPDLVWKGQVSIVMTHQATLNQALNGLRRLKTDAHLIYGDLFSSTKLDRELFSYRFPASGLSLTDAHRATYEDVYELCRLLADLSQLNSECLEQALVKHATGSYQVLENDTLFEVLKYNTSQGTIFDSDDVSRMARSMRGKDQRVTNLSFIATEGFRDDVFGAWCCEEGVGFDPDDYQWLLLR